MVPFSFKALALVALSFSRTTLAALTAEETDERITIQNDRLFASMEKASSGIDRLTLDGQNLLGTTSGHFGTLYQDCYCTPEGFWTPGGDGTRHSLYQGTDSEGVDWALMSMGSTYESTGQVYEQYWALHGEQTGLHTFTRLYYYNETTPFLRNLQELRTLFRPNSDLWTDLATNEIQFAPLPQPNPANGGGTEGIVTVQDATWDLSNRTDDPYVEQESDWFTKYTFQDDWRDHDAHGLYADGSTSDSGNAFGAWMVMNTRDTYFGGPLSSDLTVDGIVYNYISSNHHGDQTPNITNGFDRTFGPFFYYFNTGPAGTTLEELRSDAASYANPEFDAAFYDEIAEYVPNYVPTSGRGTFSAKINLPKGAKRPLAVLAQNGIDFQDNVFDTKAYQYWADIDPRTGHVEISRVKAGTYRLTVYADGIFGQLEKDDIKVRACKTTRTNAHWREESAGQELWRIGTPDKSSGEYKHGYERDPYHPLHPEEYRIYWGAYDFLYDFPEGVTYTVGESSEQEDLNYVHWSVFGGYANQLRPEQVEGDGNINNWTVLFDASQRDLHRKTQATLTIQLAGAKTAAGNTDIFNASEPYSNLPYTVVINGHELEPWIIPYYQSSSCAVRSAVICYNLAHKFVFPAKYLKRGENELILSLPFNGTDYESALLPRSVYVQYDALRMELK